jgi:hypothetical protein
MNKDGLYLYYRWQLMISFSSCFAGGVFIAACLLDLLPDVEEKIDQVFINLISLLYILIKFVDFNLVDFNLDPD